MSSLGLSARSLSYLKGLFSRGGSLNTKTSQPLQTPLRTQQTSPLSLKVTEQAVQSLIDMLYVVFKSFIALGVLFKSLESPVNAEVQQVYDNVCRGSTSTTYFELLNDPDLLWSTFLRCLLELRVFTPEEAVKLVIASDEETIVVSAQLSLPLRRLLGALLSGLSFVLDGSHVAVSLSILNTLTAALFPSLEDSHTRLQGFFNIAANASAAFFYYEPFSVRLGMKIQPHPEVLWRQMERRIFGELDLPMKLPLPAPADSDTSSPPIRTEEAFKPTLLLKGVTEESLRELFLKSLAAGQESLSAESRADLG